LRLANPPVVEVGIDFRFDPDPERPPWDLPVAMPFLDRFRDTFPSIEIIQSEEIRIEKRSPQGLPTSLSGKISLDHVRANDQEERRRVEVGNDRMAFRVFRGGAEYPGFDAVLQEALRLLTEYIEHFRPTAVRRAILTYSDIVRIPMGPGEGVELNDYFRLQVKLPEDPFGPLGAFSVRLALPRSPYADALQVFFGTEPKVEEGVVRFRIRWQSSCEEVNSLDQNDLSHRLAVAHEHLVKCFLACFTERGLELFNPTGL
jgi:uncharacterized protein (TIGR04255 family)